MAFPFPGSCGASFRVLKVARRGPACSAPPPRTPVSGPSLVWAVGGDGRKQLGRRFLQARPDSSLSVASSSPVLPLCVFPSGLVARTVPLLTAGTLVLQASQLFLSPQPELLFPLPAASAGLCSLLSLPALLLAAPAGNRSSCLGAKGRLCIPHPP